MALSFSTTASSEATVEPGTGDARWMRTALYAGVVPLTVLILLAAGWYVVKGETPVDVVRRLTNPPSVTMALPPDPAAAKNKNAGNLLTPPPAPAAAGTKPAEKAATEPAKPAEPAIADNEGAAPKAARGALPPGPSPMKPTPLPKTAEAKPAEPPPAPAAPATGAMPPKAEAPAAPPAPAAGAMPPKAEAPAAPPAPAAGAMPPKPEPVAAPPPAPAAGAMPTKTEAPAPPPVENKEAATPAPAPAASSAQQAPTPVATAPAAPASPAPAPAAPAAQQTVASNAPPPPAMNEPRAPPGGEPLAPPSYAQLPARTDLKPALAAPQPDLLKDSPDGPLPVIDGTKEARLAYARAFVPPKDAKEPFVKVAVVVVGLGLSREAAEAAIAKLPPEVSLSFSPYAGGLDAWLKKARDSGHEVLLDLPLEPPSYPLHDAGPLAILSRDGPNTAVDRLQQVLGKGTGYVGVAAGLRSPIATGGDWGPVMKELKSRGLLAIGDGPAAPDMPAYAPVALVPDQTPFRAAIDVGLDRLLAAAQRDGTAVAYVSPRPVTFERLLAWAASLPQKGAVLVPVSAVTKTQS